MRYIVLDIETIAHPDASQWLEPVEPDPALLEPILPDSRLKDPAKVAANLEDVARKIAARPAQIAASILERTKERDEKLGLDPDCCRIVALGYHVVGGADPVVELCRDEAEERSALERFWLAYKAIGNTKLVTFYGRQFDLPVLMRRSLYLGIPYPTLNIDRWKSPHIDVWDVLTFHGALRTARGLQFYAKRLGLPMLDKVNGADVAKLVEAGDWESVSAHCLSDIGYTHAISNRLGLLEYA